MNKIQQLAMMGAILSNDRHERTEIYNTHISAIKINQESIDIAIKDSNMKRQMKSMKKEYESYHRSLGARPLKFTSKEWKSYSAKSFYELKLNR